MMPRVTNVPAVVEHEFVGTIGRWIDRVAALLTSEASRQRLREMIKERLREGSTIAIDQIIAAAEAGHQDADLALREHIAEFIDHNRGELPPLEQLRGYTVKSVLRPPVTYPRGKNIADIWMRDIGIAVMVDLAAERWGMPPTRGRNTEEPAAAYFVSLALKQRRIKLKEQQVGRIHRELHRLAQRLTASVDASAF
jgi:hypothetical protein